jgi:hypothetical protein
MILNNGSSTIRHEDDTRGVIGVGWWERLNSSIRLCCVFVCLRYPLLSFAYFLSDRGSALCGFILRVGLEGRYMGRVADAVICPFGGYGR